jgi:hypothetical protein
MNIISAFSSDSRELYKADIYRVLSLPKNHIVHFRYKNKYVDDNLLRNTNLHSQQVAIFFTHGNNLDSQNNTFTHHSTRLANITKIELSKITDVYHVYMALGDFCHITIDSGNSPEKMPPKKFFSELSCTRNVVGNEWHERITAIKDSFPKVMFFHLKGIEEYNCKTLVMPQNQNDGKSSIYNLTHGNRYVLKLAISNPDNSDAKLEIVNPSQDIIINCINPFESSIQFDDHDILTSVKSLQVLKQASLLEFKPIVKNNSNMTYETLGEYSTNIELNLELGLKKPATFGFFSTIGFWAVLLAKPLNHSDITSHIFDFSIASILFFIASSTLFYWFNKR